MIERMTFAPLDNPGGVQFRVDLELLQDMARRLGRVAADLNAAPEVVGDYTTAAGTRVAGSLERFAAGWAPRRRQMVKLIDQLSILVSLAGDAYGSTDASLIGTVGNGTARQ